MFPEILDEVETAESELSFAWDTADELDLADLPTFDPTPAVPAQTAHRVLRFPRGRRLGSLTIRPAGGGEWRELGDAVGEVVLPCGFDVGLRFEAGRGATLADLDGLRPHDLQRLDLSGAQLHAGDLKRIARLRGLSELALSWTNIDADGLTELAPLIHLKALDLGQTPLSDAACQALANFVHVETLSLRGTRVGDAGVETLLRLPALATLDLAATRIGDAALATLADSPTLAALDVSSNPWPRLSARGLRALAAASNLRKLRLGWTDFDDAQLSSLADFALLEELDLSGTRATDATVVRLVELPLKRLTLCAVSGVTNTGVLALRDCPTLERLEIHQMAADNLGVFSLWSAKPRCLVNGLTQASWRAGTMRGQWSPTEPIVTPAV
jgi:hypothetical protein